MPALKFETNVTNELRMRSLAGELVESQFGGMQFRFVTDAGAFYVSEPVGNILHDRFAKLGVTAGEPVEITKREVVKNGRKSIQWEVAKVGFTPGEQPDGTFAVPAASPADEPSMLERQLAASLAEVNARKVPARAAAPAAVPAGWQSTLLAQTNALADVYAAACAYASERHGNVVRPEDIRAMMTTVFINLSKSGQRNAA
jgi:hypothetical protein